MKEWQLFVMLPIYWNVVFQCVHEEQASKANSIRCQHKFNNISNYFRWLHFQQYNGNRMHWMSHHSRAEIYMNIYINGYINVRISAYVWRASYFLIVLSVQMNSIIWAASIFVGISKFDIIRCWKRYVVINRALNSE